MFVRFTILANDPDSGRLAGVLTTAHKLRDETDLTVEQHRELRAQLIWFNTQMKVPPCLKEPKNRRALSWFKEEAIEPIRRMWALKSILDQHDVHVEVLKTDNPGRVIYEDGWQVVAMPKTGKRIR